MIRIFNKNMGDVQTTTNSNAQNSDNGSNTKPTPCVYYNIKAVAGKNNHTELKACSTSMCVHIVGQKMAPINSRNF